MTLRSIAIRNKSGVSQSFGIAQAAPPPVNDSQNSTCTTVLLASPLVDGDGSASVQFDLSSEYYAFCGTGSRDGNGRLYITITKSLPAELGSNTSKGSKFELTKPDSFGPATLSLRDESVSTSGAFSILTDASFSNQDSDDPLYMGVAVKVPHSEVGRIVPIIATKACPNIQTTFYPESKYYVLPGMFEPGAVISPREFSNALVVNFAGLQGNNAKYVFDGRFTFQPENGLSQV